MVGTGTQVLSRCQETLAGHRTQTTAAVAGATTYRSPLKQHLPTNSQIWPKDCHTVFAGRQQPHSLLKTAFVTRSCLRTFRSFSPPMNTQPCPWPHLKCHLPTSHAFSTLPGHFHSYHSTMLGPPHPLPLTLPLLRPSPHLSQFVISYPSLCLIPSTKMSSGSCVCSSRACARYIEHAVDAQMDWWMNKWMLNSLPKTSKLVSRNANPSAPSWKPKLRLSLQAHPESVTCCPQTRRTQVFHRWQSLPCMWQFLSDVLLQLQRLNKQQKSKINIVICKWCDLMCCLSYQHSCWLLFFIMGSAELNLELGRVSKSSIQHFHYGLAINSAVSL